MFACERGWRPPHPCGPSRLPARRAGTPSSVSPAFQLARLLGLVRGRRYEDAVRILTYFPQRLCEPLLTTLVSAASNAHHLQGAAKNALWVVEAWSGPGPVLKRAFPRARGKMDMHRRPTFHLTVRVSTRAPETKTGKGGHARARARGKA